MLKESDFKSTNRLYEKYKSAQQALKKLEDQTELGDNLVIANASFAIYPGPFVCVDKDMVKDILKMLIEHYRKELTSRGIQLGA